MNLPYLYIGISIIVIGFLVKIFPYLIAGYNAMTKEQKENTDIKGFSTLMRNSFIVIGVAIILFCSLLSWTWSFSLILFGGIIFLLIKAQKYNHTKKG